MYTWNDFPNSNKARKCSSRKVKESGPSPESLQKVSRDPPVPE